ncbi:MAG: hypothetical protein H7096_13550 [Flavobacterium sp.]|nr:hypothetical protein [Pedobacter sp.]
MSLLKRGYINFILLFTAYIFIGWQIQDTIVELISPKNSTFPEEYFISKIEDSRFAKGAIGTVNVRGESTNRPLNLKGGILLSFQRFLFQSVHQDNQLRPIIFNIKEFNVSENLQPDGTVKGDIKLTVSFEIIKNSQRIILVEYNGGSKYTRSANNLKVLEPALSRTVINSIQYFNKWINLEINTNEKLADRLVINIKDFESSVKNDTVYYSRTRKLVWSDFKSRSDLSSRFDAEIFPFFSFDQSGDLNMGVLSVQLVLKAYLVKSFSWVRASAQTSQTLNHEQRHFDLVKIVANNFKQKVLKANLNIHNYQGILTVEYLESLREMNRLQVKYDLETNHGTALFNQQKWNKLIDDDLRIIPE